MKRKWQGLTVEFRKDEDGSVNLFLDELHVLAFLADKKEVEFIENGITLNEGVKSVISLDDRRGIDDPEPYCEQSDEADHDS